MKKFSQNTVRYYRDFGEFITEIGSHYRGRRALSWFTRKKEEQSRTYDELIRDVEGLRESLCARKLAGKHIALVGENCYYWLVTYLACTLCGAAAVCIDPEQPDEVIRAMLLQADVSAVFASTGCSGVCGPVLEKRPEMMGIFSLNSQTGQEEMAVGRLCREGSRLLEQCGGKTGFPVELDPEAPAAIVFTSGTTGESKPVMLSQRALLNNASESNCYVDGGIKAFSALPFCHAYGMTCAVLATFARGAELCFNGNLKTAIRDMRLSGAYSMLAVPLMGEALHSQIWLEAERHGEAEKLRGLLKKMKFRGRLGMKKPCRALEELRRKHFGTLRVILFGGAHMNEKCAEEFRHLGLTVLEGYGITECGPLVSVNGAEWNRQGSVGRILPSCQVKIEDDEILVRGSMLMSGYYGMPDESAAAVRDGWFHTGDLGKLDKDGFLYITGRRKNLVVFKNGKKISPEGLEMRLRQIPLVKDVMVYGAESGKAADDVKLAASIYPDPEQAGMMTSYEILEELQQAVDQINDGLPLYQQIQMVNIREQRFEKTSLQKIKRHTV